MPLVRTAAARSRHIEAGGKLAAVFANTNPPNRSPRFAPIHMPVKPPNDNPQKTARGIFNASE
jgi:hypothetical protein